MYVTRGKKVEGIFYPGDSLANFDNIGVGQGMFRNVNVAFMADEKIISSLSIQ